VKGFVPQPRKAGTARNTQAHFQITGIEKVMEDLRGPRSGVRAVQAFKDYQSEAGVIEMGGYKVVFVKDSEGNTLEIAAGSHWQLRLLQVRRAPPA
jgi:hypothetical protein